MKRRDVEQSMTRRASLHRKRELQEWRQAHDAHLNDLANCKTIFTQGDNVRLACKSDIEEGRERRRKSIQEMQKQLCALPKHRTRSTTSRTSAWSYQSKWR
jgi:hypothetical protein